MSYRPPVSPTVVDTIGVSSLWGAPPNVPEERHFFRGEGSPNPRRFFSLEHALFAVLDLSSQLMEQLARSGSSASALGPYRGHEFTEQLLH